MTPLLTRILLAALAGGSILLARKALHKQALAASSQAANSGQASRWWVGAGQPGPLSARALPAFYQVRWLGPPRAGQAANGR